MAALNDSGLKSALREARATGKDVWRTDESGSHGSGSLRFRARPNGQGIFYYRYTRSDGKREPMKVGVYDPKGVKGVSLKQARTKFHGLARQHQDGKRDLRTHLEREAEERRLAAEAADRERAAAAEHATAKTLRALLNAYTNHLEAQGKPSARDTRNIIRHNVFDAWLTLPDKAARDVTVEDVTAILAKMIERGAGRTASKLRSYFVAAYGLALRASSDPRIPSELHGFKLAGNPAAIVPAMPEFNRARDRNLNEPELKAYVEGVQALDPGPTRDTLMLALYLGGQRLTMLGRVAPADIDLHSGTITLYDKKGKRQKPRVHRLPLTNRAQAIVKRRLELAAAAQNPYVFAGPRKVPVRVETLSNAVCEIAREMVKAGTAREHFQMRDVRRTCETIMRRKPLSIPKEICSQIQSHGLGGVQQRHYDMNEYLDEKREALKAWDKRLRAIEKGQFTRSATVVPIKRARRKAA